MILDKSLYDKIRKLNKLVIDEYEYKKNKLSKKYE